MCGVTTHLEELTKSDPTYIPWDDAVYGSYDRMIKRASGETPTFPHACSLWMIKGQEHTYPSPVEANDGGNILSLPLNSRSWQQACWEARRRRLVPLSSVPSVILIVCLINMNECMSTVLLSWQPALYRSTTLRLECQSSLFFCAAVHRLLSFITCHQDLISESFMKSLFRCVGES